MAISLLVGNGINLLSNKDASWKDVLRSLHDPKVSSTELEYLEQKPFALVYEEILLTESLPYKQVDELDMKKRIADLVNKISINDFHRRIMNSGVKHVLTTNYDYSLEKASGLRNERKNLMRENKFSVFRRRSVGSTYVWHIHGESEAPNSITLGYDQYSGYLQKLRGHAMADRESQSGSPFKRGDRNFDDAEGTVYSWLDVFLRDDIHIIGLGLNYTEIDLWWALTYKARLKARGWTVGKTFFHDWYFKRPDKHALAKRSLLRALAVEVKPHYCAADAESAYDEFINIYL